MYTITLILFDITWQGLISGKDGVSCARMLVLPCILFESSLLNVLKNGKRCLLHNFCTLLGILILLVQTACNITFHFPLS